MALEAQALWLQNHSGVTLLLEAHADDPGDDAANVDLSRRRAETVRAKLVALGIAPSRIVVAPLGRTKPAAVCKAQDCRAHNRRVISLVQEMHRADAGEPAPRGIRAALRQRF